MLSHLLLLPLMRPNIPNGYIIPCYPLNIQFGTRNPPQHTQQQVHPPACHIWHCCHLFTSIPYPLLNTPTLLHTPALPYGTLSISDALPTHPKYVICHPNKPWLPGRTFILTVFWVVGKTWCGYISLMGHYPVSCIRVASRGALQSLFENETTDIEPGDTPQWFWEGTRTNPCPITLRDFLMYLIVPETATLLITQDLGISNAEVNKI